MKKVLIITKNVMPGVRKVVEHQGEVEVATLHNLKLGQHGKQLALINIVEKACRSIHDYDQVVIYVGLNEPRLPVMLRDLQTLDQTKVILVMNCHLSLYEQAVVVEDLGYELPDPAIGKPGVQVVQVIQGDENGIDTMLAIRQAFLNHDPAIDKSLRLDELWKKAPPL